MKRLAFLFFALLSLTAMYGQTPISVQISTTAPCDHDATASATVTGGTPPYSYSWTYQMAWNQPVQVFTTASLSNLTGGSLNLVVTDANGLQGTASGYIEYPYYVHVDSVTVLCPATTATMSASIWAPNGVGAPPYTYSWNTGATTPTITGTVGVIYNLWITDANGCKVSSLESGSSGTVWSYAYMPMSISTTPANCLNGTATVNSVTNALPPYTYSWSNGQTTTTATNLVANNYYSIWVTDAQGCTGSSGVYVPTNVTLQGGAISTAENCNDMNGTASSYISGGTVPYTYSWNTGQTTQNITGLADGFYQVWITDANGCVGNYYTPVAESTPMVFNYSITATACTASTGAVTLSVSGGASPYTYSWSTGQTSNSISNLGEGYYNVTVSDANGCDKLGQVVIPNNSTLNISPYSTQAELCDQNNGSATVNVSGGVTPFIYSWSNGQTTQTVSNLNHGWTEVTVTDASGCHKTGYAYINQNSLISLSANTTPASCIYNADGSASLIVNGSGTPPYTYYWSNGGGNVATQNNLLPQSYYTSVTDANGCTANAYFSITNANTSPCQIDISGKVYFDQNQDCIHNPLVEPLMHNVWIEAQPNGGMQMTNNYGNYHFTLPPGTYDLVQYLPQWGTQTCPTTNPNITLAAGGSQSAVDFADDFVPIQDVSIWATNYGAPPRPGFGYSQHIVLSNPGVLMANGTVTCVHDAGVNYLSSSPPANNYDPVTRTITWNYSNLEGFGDILQYTVNYQVPTTTTAGNILLFQYQADPLIGDNTVWNNTQDYQVTVVSSYDPNYMEVSPKGAGAQGFINPSDSILTYTTHFQNTGSYYATFVRLEIPLDVDLRNNSIEIVAASHAYTAEIRPDNTLVIYFDYINLADSLSNSNGSKGFVTFRLHLKGGLTNGTQIINHSNIFFDYNPAVVTNEVKNTLKGTIAIEKPEVSFFNLYPNPAKDEVVIVFEDKIAENEVVFYDILGHKVKSITLEKGIAQSTTSVLDFATGVYVYQAYSNGKLLKTGKLSVVK